MNHNRIYILLSVTLFFALGLGCSQTDFAGSSADKRQSSRGNTGANDANGNSQSGDGVNGQQGDGTQGQLFGDEGGGDDNLFGDDEDLDSGEDGSNGDDLSSDDLQIDDDAISMNVSVDVMFKRLADNAALTNCLFITVNDESEEYLGCNKVDVDVVKTLTLRKAPYCNTLKFRFTTSGLTQFDTSNPNAVRYENNNSQNLAHFHGIKFFPMGNNDLGAHVNDNGDEKNHTDTSFQLTGFDEVNYTIENTNRTCN